MTQTKWPPENPGRFKPPNDSGLGGMFFYSNHFLYLSN